MRTCQALPKCTSGGPTLRLGRKNRSVPSLNAIDKETVVEAALVGLGDLLDGKGSELGIASVDVPCDGQPREFSWDGLNLYER